MVTNPLSKKGFIGIGLLTAAFTAIMMGYLGAFGADLYNFSKVTMINSPFQSIFLLVLLLISIGFVAGVALIIYDIWSKRKKPYGVKTPEVDELSTQSSFEAQIINKKSKYRKGKDSLEFRSRFKGNLTNGCFLNKIRIVKPPEAHDMSPYLFSANIQDVDITQQFVKSFCPQTVERWSDSITGVLNGNVNTDWFYWNWKIPRNIRSGKYFVNMTVHNNFSLTSYSGHKSIGDSFEVTD